MTTDDSALTGARRTTDPVLPSASTLGKGLAVLRIFMGVVLFANGVAKLFEFRTIEVGPYVANLIDKEAARSILRNGFEGEQERSIPGLRPVMEFVVDNWGFFGWAITVMELVVGGLLIVGALTRLVALIGLGQALFLALVFATRAAVQGTLYVLDRPGLLAAARLLMGWPLTIAAVALTVAGVKRARARISPAA